MIKEFTPVAANALKNCGFHQWGEIKTDSLKYYPEIRAICESNSCKGYGTSWACPPAIGTLIECRSRVEQYEKMIVFTGKFELEDSFDFEGMGEGLRTFKAMVDKLTDCVDGEDCLILSNEGCGRCKQCTYPNEPCRFPKLLHHSLEGYGFVVNELAERANIKYNNGPNTVTFFGAILHGRKGTL